MLKRIVLVALVAATPALAQAQRLDGAIGLSCRTPEAVEDFNNDTALLSDAEYYYVLQHIEEATAEQCRFGQLSGITVGIAHTFVRADQMVIDVIRYTPSNMIGGIYFFTFKARPLATDIGI